MTGKTIITINGRNYDAATGLPIAPANSHASPHHQHAHTPKPHPKPAVHRAFADISGPAPLRDVIPAAKAAQPPHHSEVKAHAVHKQLQRSQTLNRSAIKKPAPFKQPAPVRVEADTAAHQATPVAAAHHRSPAISKFGPTHQTVPVAVAAPVTTPPVAPRTHPIVTKALANRPTPAAEQSPKELKESLIRERLAEAKPNHHEVKHHRRFTSQPRLATILTSSLALLLLAGYLTYINLPNISMRVAATRAGIAANYPNYQPDGYHFAGPITYQPGEVNISFKSNTNQNDFVIKQKASTWDSQAVLDNYISKETGNYLTYQERGLTVYAFGNHAAWVNGGLLYTIDGDAPLSSDQLLHIATSM